MNEYPNSIRNNMVNTNPYRAEDYNIEITGLPEPPKNYAFQKESSNKIRNIIIVAALAAATLAGAAGVSYMQYQSYERNTAVVNTVPIDNGVEVKITENPAYSYIEMPDGSHVNSYNGISANVIAQEIIQNQIGRQK